MLRRLIINDLRSNKLINVSTTVFMTVTAMMLGLSVFLFATLFSSIDSLMTKAKTPHFLQMHTGDLSVKDINSFACQRPEVEDYQICGFLNLENGQIRIGDNSLDNNMQDNGLFCQSDKFDYLLDASDNIIQVSPGDVYVPVAYKNEYDIKAGDKMYIGSEELNVAGFMRDSQMNSMMASSKRFLVNEYDYNRLKPLGSEEYLIEFRFRDESDSAAFETAYKDADLPGNGPTITYPLIRLMNTLSDGIMIIVIMIASFVILYISVLCIRYIILTGLEKDIREIGMLKAVGISRKDINGIYLAKYIVLSLIGCISGSASACVLAIPLGRNLRELYGEAGNTILVYAFMILGAVLAEVIILLSVRHTIRRTEKISAVKALKGQTGKAKNLWIPLSVIITAAVFMMMVPDIMKETISSPDFVRYMGIGNCQIRIDVRQTEDIGSSTDALAGRIKEDNRVDKYSVMRTGSYKSFLPDGNTYNLMLENGDHAAFPLNYLEGTYPQNEKEIALSLLNSEDTGLKVGDSITVSKSETEGKTVLSKCLICGIYSDITNGGKTAKGCIKDETPAMWSVINVSLKDGVQRDSWISEYGSENIKIAGISEYMNGMYGQTIRKTGNASVMTKAVACAVIIVVMILLMRLVIRRERGESSLKKAFGFTARDISSDYVKTLIFYLLAGLSAGILSGMVLGQRLAGFLFSFMGAEGLDFVFDPLSAFVIVPALIILSVFSGAALSLREIKNIKAFECLNARE